MICISLWFGWMILLMSSNHVKPECCWNYKSELCDTWCCGCGSCNIFCCNCHNGCNLEWWHVKSYFREDPGYEPAVVEEVGGHKVDGEFHHVKVCGHWRRKRVIFRSNRNISEEALNLFYDIDIDGSMQITFKEARDYLEDKKLARRSIPPISIEHEIQKMDTNFDGLISPKEFDISLV